MESVNLRPGIKFVGILEWPQSSKVAGILITVSSLFPNPICPLGWTGAWVLKLAHSATQMATLLGILSGDK